MRRFFALAATLGVPLLSGCYSSHHLVDGTDGRDGGEHVVPDAGLLRPAERSCDAGQPCDCRAAHEIAAGLHWQGYGELDMSSGATRLTAPLHQVRLTRRTWLGTFEATAGCFHQCVWEGACTEPRWSPHESVGSDAYLGLARNYWTDSSNAYLPIVDLTRAGATEYCGWLGGRLPTDVEWEKAARGESGRAWPWHPDPLHPVRRGDPIEARTELCLRMHAFPDSGQVPNCPGTAAFVVGVDAFPMGAGPYGHLNLMGNAVEWVDDSAVPYPPSLEEPRVDPGAARVMGQPGVVRGSPSRAAFFRQPEAPSLDWFGPHYPVGVRCAFDTQPEPLLPRGEP